jgi:hypothetical protein
MAKRRRNRLLAVVLALDQRLSSDVVLVHLAGVEDDVICASRGGMDAPPAHALDDFLVIDDEFDDVIDSDAHVLEAIGLGEGARKAIQQEAGRAIGVWMRSWMRPRMMSSDTSSPESMIFFAARPRGFPLERGLPQHVARRGSAECRTFL